jgi:type II secretory pathway component PulM
MSDVTAKTAAPLDEVMLAMDVVDTLRHRQDLATRELAGVTREQQLIEKLRDIYHQQGIEVPDHILKEGVAALAESRFVYDPPKPGFGTTLARLYVGRKRWGKPVLAAVAIIVLAAVGWFGIWQPYQSGQAEQARIELAEGLPAQMDALYQTIFEETKVQQAVVQAEALRTRGKTFAAEGNRTGAEAAVTDLTALRDQLRQEYVLQVVNRSGEKSGFWTFPEINTDATNYYVVVEALDADGNKLSLPVRNEENGQTEIVNVWGVRVPEAVYEAVSADKLDDGIIQGSELGRKSDGFLDVEYNVPVLGGAVTRW